MALAVDHREAHALDGGVVEPITFARSRLRVESDARLVQLAAQGHERPFEVIVERYRRPLERYCGRMLSPALAEEVVQQAFLAAWLALRQGTHVHNLRGWLYRIAHNAALAAAKRPDVDCRPLRETDRCADGADSVLERHVTARDVLAALAALPERQRQALLRIAVESRDSAEVAEELGVTRNALRQLVFRARSSLRAAAYALSPPHLAAWIASLGQAGGGAATVAGGGALVKVGVTAIAAGALAVSTAAVVDSPILSRDGEDAAASARAERGAAGVAGPAWRSPVVDAAVPVRVIDSSQSTRTRAAHEPARRGVREKDDPQAVRPGAADPEEASVDGDEREPAAVDEVGISTDVYDADADPEPPMRASVGDPSTETAVIAEPQPAEDAVTADEAAGIAEPAARAPDTPGVAADDGETSGRPRNDRP